MTFSVVQAKQSDYLKQFIDLKMACTECPNCRFFYKIDIKTEKSQWDTLYRNNDTRCKSMVFTI